LVTAGGDGIVRIWHASSGNCFFEKVCSNQKEPIYAFCTNATESLLIVGDAAGFIHIYDISKAGLQNDMELNPDLDMMPLQKTFRAHLNLITDLQCSSNYIVTSSTDCMVRMFTMNGYYIGTLGQQSGWSLSELDLDTIQYPADLMNEYQDSLESEQKSAKKNLMSDDEQRIIEKELGGISQLRDALSSSEQSNGSRYSRSIYAKERFRVKGSRRTFDTPKIYHELAEIPSFTLPRNI
jgi:WD40 repeat protein